MTNQRLRNLKDYFDQFEMFLLFQYFGCGTMGSDRPQSTFAFPHQVPQPAGEQLPLHFRGAHANAAMIAAKRRPHGAAWA
jgi:hypothetical protein